jgi:hypothetical protein
VHSVPRELRRLRRHRATSSTPNAAGAAAPDHVFDQKPQYF